MPGVLFIDEAGSIRPDRSDFSMTQHAHATCAPHARLFAPFHEVEEVHMLDIECFSFLNRALEVHPMSSRENFEFARSSHGLSSCPAP